MLCCNNIHAICYCLHCYITVSFVSVVALWCSGSMLASHARGPGFNPRAG